MAARERYRPHITERITHTQTPERYAERPRITRAQYVLIHRNVYLKIRYFFPVLLECL